MAHFSAKRQFVRRLLWASMTAWLSVGWATETSAHEAAASERQGESLARGEWAHIETWEYFATGATLATGLGLRFIGPHRSANWQGGIGLDDELLARVRLGNRRTFDFALWTNQVLFAGGIAYRLVDSTILPLAKDDPKLALALTMIDLEAFATVGMVLWGSQLFVRRERPLVDRCDEPDFADLRECDSDDPDRNRSFIMGHVATSLTAAGLTCTHHGRLRLYGGDADTIACGAALGAAGLTGWLRLTTEHHYPSDAVFGVALGVFAGWIVPRALHYGFGDPAGPRNAAVSARLLPWFDADRGGIAAVGHF